MTVVFTQTLTSQGESIFKLNCSATEVGAGRAISMTEVGAGRAISMTEVGAGRAISMTEVGAGRAISMTACVQSHIYLLVFPSPLKNPIK